MIGQHIGRSSDTRVAARIVLTLMLGMPCGAAAQDAEASTIGDAPATEQTPGAEAGRTDNAPALRLNGPRTRSPRLIPPTA
jgi:hypothetical protein